MKNIKLSLASMISTDDLYLADGQIGTLARHQLPIRCVDELHQMADIVGPGPSVSFSMWKAASTWLLWHAKA